MFTSCASRVSTYSRPILPTVFFLNTNTERYNSCILRRAKTPTIIYSCPYPADNHSFGSKRYILLQRSRTHSRSSVGVFSAKHRRRYNRSKRTAAVSLCLCHYHHHHHHCRLPPLLFAAAVYVSVSLLLCRLLWRVGGPTTKDAIQRSG